MASRDLAIEMIFLSQMIFGILGNFSLLYHYIFISFTGCRLRPIDLILKQLIVANSLVILIEGIPQTMTAFGLKDLFNNFVCKVVYYLQKVGRGVSIGTTCLLSIFQAIMISSRNSRWAELELMLQSILAYHFLMLDHLHAGKYYFSYVYDWQSEHQKYHKLKKILDAIFLYINTKSQSLHAGLLLFPDILCLGLMLWANGSMVYNLYRHKHRVQCIHKNNVSPRSSSESRATQTILVLVSTFVFFYTLSSIFHVCLALFSNPSWWLVSTSSLIALCFLTLNTFVLICHDPTVFRLYSAQ